MYLLSTAASFHLDKVLRLSNCLGYNRFQRTLCTLNNHCVSLSTSVPPDRLCTIPELKFVHLISPLSNKLFSTLSCVHYGGYKLLFLLSLCTSYCLCTFTLYHLIQLLKKSLSCFHSLVATSQCCLLAHSP